MVGTGRDPRNRIDELWRDHGRLVDYLRANNELQMMSRIEESFARTLVIATASYFEVKLTDAICDVYREFTQGASSLTLFVRKQGIGRRFAQLFDWGNDSGPAPNANRFYKLFGDEFAVHMRRKVQGDRFLDEGVRAFLEIGNIRNQMVHGNFADFQIDKTVDDLYDLYGKADRFVTAFRFSIREFEWHNGLGGGC